MPIDRTHVEQAAALARLQLAADELDGLVEDCRAILDHFDKIREAEVGDLEPAAAAGRPTPQRDDEVDGDRLQRALSRIAPAWQEGYFVLPRLPAMEAETGGGEAGSGESR